MIRLWQEAGPRPFDFEATAGPQAGSRALGIFREEGGRLTMCLGADRPAGFDGGGAAALIELTRLE